MASCQPRNFKLLDEFDAAIGKSGKSLVTGRHQGHVMYGLQDEEDTYLKKWKGMIIGIQGQQTGQFIYNVEIMVPMQYPKVPPQVRFISPRIAMACVDEFGRVNINKIQPKFVWNSSKNIADILMALRDNMYDKTVNKSSESLGNTHY